jgi:hypothetical protein
MALESDLDGRVVSRAGEAARGLAIGVARSKGAQRFGKTRIKRRFTSRFAIEVGCSGQHEPTRLTNFLLPRSMTMPYAPPLILLSIHWQCVDGPDGTILVGTAEPLVYIYLYQEQY